MVHDAVPFVIEAFPKRQIPLMAGMTFGLMLVFMIIKINHSSAAVGVPAKAF